MKDREAVKEKSPPGMTKINATIWERSRTDSMLKIAYIITIFFQKDSTSLNS